MPSAPVAAADTSPELGPGDESSSPEHTPGTVSPRPELMICPAAPGAAVGTVSAGGNWSIACGTTSVVVTGSVCRVAGNARCCAWHESQTVCVVTACQPLTACVAKGASRPMSAGVLRASTLAASWSTVTACVT